MRAVNLIPVEDRRGRAAAARAPASPPTSSSACSPWSSRMSAAYTLDQPLARARARRARRRVQSQAETAEAQAQRSRSYTDFAALRQKRTETVRSLAASRFDWSHALHELARTIPSNAWLTSLQRHRHARRHRRRRQHRSAARRRSPNPAIESSAARPARPTSRKVIVEPAPHRRRRAREPLVVAEARAGRGATAPAGGSDGDCRNGNAHYPQFSMTLFFANPTTSAAGAQTAAATTTP